MTPNEASEFEKLRESFDDLSSSLNSRKAWRRTVSILSAIAVVALLFNSFSNRATLGAVKHASKDARDSAALLVDCTTPSTESEPHLCWDRLRTPSADGNATVQKLLCTDLVLAGYRIPDCKTVIEYIDSLPKS